MSWRRVRAGSGHRYVDDDGEPVDGVTTIIGNGIPKPQLVDASARETAAYAVDHWEELTADRVADRLRKLERGRFERWNRGTMRGTQIHAYAAQLVRGEPVEIADDAVGYVDAYLAFVNDWQIDELHVETMVLSRRWRYAGTLDLLAMIGGAVWLLDWKTGASGVWPEAALQLAAYAHAETLVTSDGLEAIMPTVEHAACVWLRSDGYDVIPVDIGEDTFRAFLYAQQVARFRAQPRDATVGAALTAPALEAAQP